MSDGPTCYIVDLRSEWARKPYITVWRPDDCGYAFPLSWAGRYEWSKIEAGGSYYATRQGTTRWKRFPVPCEVVERLAIPKPKPGIIDNDAGPVLVNDRRTRAALLKAKKLPAAVMAGSQRRASHD